MSRKDSKEQAHEQLQTQAEFYRSQLLLHGTTSILACLLWACMSWAYLDGHHVLKWLFMAAFACVFVSTYLHFNRSRSWPRRYARYAQWIAFLTAIYLFAVMYFVANNV